LHVEFDEAVASKLVSGGDSQARDAMSNPIEQDMQRWYVDSFMGGLDTGSNAMR